MNKIKKLILIFCAIIIILFLLLMLSLKISNIHQEEKAQSINDVKGTGNSFENQKRINEKDYYTVTYIIEKYSRDENLTFVPLRIRLKSGINADTYLVDGYFANKEYKVIERMYLYVNLDRNNKVYSIQKLDYNNIDYNNLEIENPNVKIEKDIDNSYADVIIDENYIVKKCFENLKLNLILNNKYVYQKLDEEYRNLKFSSEKEYSEYIENNKEKYKKMDLLKYAKEENNEEIKYTLINNYYDYYVITIYKDKIDYSIMLDNYTIYSDKMKEEYNKSSSKKKIYTNTDIFLNMINNKDYESAYRILNEEYKAENFQTIDAFKEFIKNTFYDYNVIGANFDIAEGEDRQFMMSFMLKSGTAVASYEKEMRFIINLSDDTKFNIEISK